MAGKPSNFDKTRLKIIDSLNDKNSVKPNLINLKKSTGFHLATIKSSIDFLKKQKVLRGFGPKLDFQELGFKVEATTLLQADFSKKKLFDEFLDLSNADNHTYWISGVMGFSNFNLIQKQIFKDIESYQKVLQDHYIEKMTDYFSFIKERQVFFTVAPIYKNSSRTGSAIKLVQNINLKEKD